MHDQLTPFEHKCLKLRNLFVIIAAALFILSILDIAALEAYHHLLSSVAYFFGAGAYICEIVELSDEEKRKSPHHSMHAFMPRVFGVLYLVLGLAHLFE